jgi:hypothetical protein
MPLKDLEWDSHRQILGQWLQGLGILLNYGKRGSRYLHIR